MDPITRERTESFHAHRVHHGTRSKLYPVLDSDYFSSGGFHGTQRTVSEGHPFSRKGSRKSARSGRTVEDVGGEFFTRRSRYRDNSRDFTVWSGEEGNSAFRTGPIFAHLAGIEADLSSVFPLLPSSAEALNAAGTTAIARTVPTTPVADLATFFGELREGFPKIIGSSAFRKEVSSARKLGDEYLNWEFGIKPFVSDLIKWHTAYRNADKIWQQFLRDSGRLVRRRYTFPETKEVILSEVTQAFPAGQNLVGLGSFFQDADYRKTSEITLSRQQWFSGAYTYFLDDDVARRKTFTSQMRYLDKLYGVKITPEVLWNLAPWSWAVDWFSNTGDILSNVSAFSQDGLVVAYGYLMEESTLHATYTMENVRPKGHFIPNLWQDITTTVKVRKRATPYGFGVDESSLSARQLAIIGALGLTRGR